MDTSDEMNCVTESEVIITLLDAKLKDKKCMKYVNVKYDAQKWLEYFLDAMQVNLWKV